MFDSLNWEIVLTLIGTIIALAAPIVGMLFRREEYKQLDIVLDREVFIVNQLAGKLSNFSILIDGKPASTQVLWLTGWILNSGNFDISEKIIERPLKLLLPENMRWLHGNIKHCSRETKCSVDMVGPQELQFNWILLKSGEYIYFDTLVECPLEETREAWELNSLVETIVPDSRIENIQTKSILRLFDLGERYNPSAPPKPNIIPKIGVTFVGILLLTILWMRIFFAFELDSIFGDGFLAAAPNLEILMDEKSFVADIAVNRHENVKLTFNETEENRPPYKVVIFRAFENLYSDRRFQIDKVLVRDHSKDAFAVISLAVIAIGVAWGLLYMWAPGVFLFDSRKRRAATALFALKKGEE